MTEQSMVERFLEKVSPEPNSGCWIWVGASCGRYGQISVNGRLQKAHRVSYELKHGPIPAGMLACHKCDNPLCVNPDHIFLGTQADNLADMSRKGRNAMQRHPERSSLYRSHKPAPTGSKHHNYKLSDEQMREMRRLHATGISTRKLGSLFGVSGGHAAKVVNPRYQSRIDLISEALKP